MTARFPLPTWGYNGPAVRVVPVDDLDFSMGAGPVPAYVAPARSAPTPARDYGATVYRAARATARADGRSYLTASERQAVAMAYRR